MKVSVPEGRPSRLGSETILHLPLGWNSALVLGWEPVGVRSSTLVDPVPMNLSNKAI